MKKKPACKPKKGEVMKDTIKEAKFEHKIVKDARKMAKDVKSGRKEYGK